MLLLACLILQIINTLASAETIDLYTPASTRSGLSMVSDELVYSLSSDPLLSVNRCDIDGSSGERVLAYFLDLTENHSQRLLLHSAPMLLKDKRKFMDYTYHDLKPVARLMTDHSALVVRLNASWFTFSDLCRDFDKNALSIIFGGGSLKNNFDHLVINWLMYQGQYDHHKVDYIPFHGGGLAMSALLDDKIDVLSTSISEALPYHRSNQVRILCTTAPEVIEDIDPCMPGVVLENWRGVFTNGDSSEKTLSHYQQILENALSRDSWLETEKKYGWNLAYLSGEAFQDYLYDYEKMVHGMKETLATPF